MHRRIIEEGRDLVKYLNLVLEPGGSEVRRMAPEKLQEIGDWIRGTVEFLEAYFDQEKEEPLSREHCLEILEKFKNWDHGAKSFEHRAGKERTMEDDIYDQRRQLILAATSRLFFLTAQGLPAVELKEEETGTCACPECGTFLDYVPTKDKPCFCGWHDGEKKTEGGGA